MKKLFPIMLAMLLVLLSGVSVFAGDVPESLLYEDTAQVFLGTVVNYTTKERPSAPYIEIDTLECIPTEKIKGDVEIGVKQSYQRCRYASIDFKPDVVYLFGYFDNNNVDIYEIESRENGKFKLVNSEIHDMTKRFEDYLNDGLFEEAEAKRLAKIEQATTSETGEADKPSEINTETDHQSLIISIAVGIAILLALVAGIILIIKRKSK